MQISKDHRGGERLKIEFSFFSRSQENGFTKRLCLGITLLVLMLSFLPVLHAQTTAQPSGVVTDSTGAVVPGATVTLVNEATQDARVVTTNSAGLYSFPALLPSSYTLKVTAKGFEPRNLTGIILHAGDERAVPAFTLNLGAETQTVTVQAAGE